MEAAWALLGIPALFRPLTWFDEVWLAKPGISKGMNVSHGPSNKATSELEKQFLLYNLGRRDFLCSAIRWDDDIFRSAAPSLAGPCENTRAVS